MESVVEEEGVRFRFLLRDHSPSLKEIKAGTDGRNPQVGTMEEACS